MLRVLATLMAWVMLLHIVPAAYGDGMMETRIRSFPTGTRIEVRLRDGQKVRGTKGAEGERSFLLFDDRSVERKIAYEQVARVREIQQTPSRKSAYILFGVTFGIAVAISIAMAVHFANQCKSLSCAGK